MPFGDRTGPWGGGPLTGRGLGYCAPREMIAASGRWNVPYGRPLRIRRGFGRGGGRGYRGYGFRGRDPYVGGWDTLPEPMTREPSTAEETRRLQARAADVKTELEAIEARLAQLEGQSATSDPGSADA